MTTSEQTNVETPKTGQSTKPITSASVKTASRKTRENKQDKAVRLLVHGRLRVTRVEGDLVMAECRGDTGRVYELGFSAGRWSCSCPARTDCSHLIALWRVTVA